MSPDVESIKAAVDLASIANRYGIPLRKSGAQLLGLCPFHKERTPSFYLHPTKQVFKCHGCGAGGDVIRFVELIEHVDFPRALAIVADLTGVRLSSAPWTPAQKREYAEHQTDRDLAKHFGMIQGIPERESSRAAAAYRALCAADPNFREWLVKDLGHAEAITALIVTMLARSQRHGGGAEATA